MSPAMMASSLPKKWGGGMDAIHPVSRRLIVASVDLMQRSDALLRMTQERLERSHENILRARELIAHASAIEARFKFHRERAAKSRTRHKRRAGKI